MNERIRELAEQAEEYSYVEYSKKLTGYDREYFFRSKFAELIVRECANICKEQEYKYWRSSEEDEWTPIDSANAIQEHFGVDE